MCLKIHTTEKVHHSITAKYLYTSIIYREVPKITFSPSSFAIRQTNLRTHDPFAPFVYINLFRLLQGRSVSSYFLPKFKELSSIAAK